MARQRRLTRQRHQGNGFILGPLARKAAQQIELLAHYEIEYRKPFGWALLADVREYCNSGEVSRGRKTEIAQLMTEMSGRAVTRDMVRGWLHDDPAKHRDPGFPYGLLLVAAGAIAIERSKHKPKKRP